MVDSLAQAGRADEARAALDSWWENERARSGRRDRQRGLWMRAILTVDPRMAGRDFQRLVLEYPGGAYSDDALLRLGLISSAVEDLPRAAGYFRTLVTDYPRSPQRRRAQEWLAENSVEVAEARAEAEATAEPETTAEPAARAQGEAGPAGVPAAVSANADGEPEEPEVDLEPAAAVSARYAVQVGAFESEERARNLLASVNASGFRARIVRVSGSELVRVRIGTFLDRSGAAELMDRVRRRGHEATISGDVAEEEPMQ